VVEVNRDGHNFYDDMDTLGRGKEKGEGQFNGMDYEFLIPTTLQM